MRWIGILSVPLVFGFSLTGVSSADGRACDRPGWRVVERGERGLVAVKGTPHQQDAPWFACLYRHDRAVRLGFNAPYLSRFVMRGDRVAYVNRAFGDAAEDPVNFLNVENVATRRSSPGISGGVMPYPRDGITSKIVLRRDGAVAWIACPFGGPRGPEGEPFHCQSRRDRPEYVVMKSNTTVLRENDYRYRRSTVEDSGRGIDPDSLRLTRTGISWRNNGELRTAELR